jgi:toxin YoeB
MRVVWSSLAWDQFERWIGDDLGMVRVIVGLIRYIREGKPGAAKELWRDLSGWDALEIAGSHRFVFRVRGGELQILSCLGHYTKDLRF